MTKKDNGFVYLKHPVDPHVVAKYRAAGFRIRDAKFKPADYKGNPKLDQHDGFADIEIPVNGRVNISASAVQGSDEPFKVTSEAGASMSLAKLPGGEGDAHSSEVAKTQTSETGAGAGGENGQGIGTDSGDQFSDKQLRAIIQEVTGTRPGNATQRPTLIERFNELNAEDADKVKAAIEATKETEE